MSYRKAPLPSTAVCLEPEVVAGEVLKEYSGVKYHISEAETSWDLAPFYCAERKMRLASISTQEEFSAMADFICSYRGNIFRSLGTMFLLTNIILSFPLDETKRRQVRAFIFFAVSN